jgi:hypothetical protein
LPQQRSKGNQVRTSVQHISKNIHSYTEFAVGGNVSLEAAIKLAKEAEKLRLVSERMLSELMSNKPAITDEMISIKDACAILNLTYTPKNKRLGNIHGNYDGRKILMKMVGLGIIKKFNEETRQFNRLEILSVKQRIERGDVNTKTIRTLKLNQS